MIRLNKEEKSQKVCLKILSRNLPNQHTEENQTDCQKVCNFQNGIPKNKDSIFSYSKTGKEPNAIAE